MQSILVINAGSSSVKFQVFSADAGADLKQTAKGQVEGIGTKPRLRASVSGGGAPTDEHLPPDKIKTVAAAIQHAGAWLMEHQGMKPTAVGHRVVHGGPKYSRPVIVDDAVLADLAKYIPLAPLHQPNNLAPIAAIRERFPHLPQVACFDTAFHRGHGAMADRYAIPERFYEEGVRRYGFHGLSYEYVADRLSTVAPDVAAKRVIVAHLGSGASMCAIADGKSVESTMGFTALDGLPMGTRPGQLDAGVVLYLMTEHKMSAEQVQSLLYGDCGLKGLSGVSNDVRELLASNAPGAKLAIDHFVYRIGLHTGMLAASLGGLDAFVFTAGIGERSAIIRRRVAERLAWLGAELDTAANDAGRIVVSTPKSRMRLLVVPTDEELMIARHTLDAIR